MPRRFCCLASSFLRQYSHPRIASNKRTASTASFTSCTRRISAPWQSARVLTTVVPLSASPGERPNVFHTIPLRDIPASTGHPSALKTFRWRSRTKFCRTSLAKPNPGSTTILDTPKARRRSTRRAKWSYTCATRSEYSVRWIIWSGSPRVCIRTYPAPYCATKGNIFGSKSPPEISLIIVAPASKVFSATSLRNVSTDISTVGKCRERASTAGTTRLISVSASATVHPGRVEHPPISRMDAPCSSIRSARRRSSCRSFTREAA